MMTKSKTMDAGIALVIAFVPVALVLLATASGPGTSPDSISYSTGALSLSQGMGLRDFSGDYLATFPPGLSIALAALLTVGLPTDVAVTSLNVVMLIATVVLGYTTARIVLPSRFMAVVILVVFAWNRSTVEVFSMLWSEPMFTALTMASMLIVVCAFKKRSISTWTSVTLGLIIAAAVSIRYSGALLAIGLVLASMTIAAPSMRVRALRLAFIAGPGLVVLAVIVLNNIRNGHGYFGDRYPSSRGLQGTVVSATDALGSLVLWRGSTSLTVLIGTIVVVFAVVGAWFGLMKRLPTTPLSLLVLTYATGLVISQSATRLDDASERLAYPIYLPLLILVAVGAQAMTFTVISNLRSRWPLLHPVVIRGAVFGPLAIVVTGVIIVGVTNSLRFSINANQFGIGYQASSIQNSPAAKLLQTIPAADAVISNEPWLVASLRPGALSLPLPPSPSEWPEERLMRDKDRIEDLVSADTPAWILIFDEGLPYEDPIGISGFESLSSVNPIFEDIDAVTLYRVVPE